MPTIRVYPDSEAVISALLGIWSSWQTGEGIFLSGGSTFRDLYARAPRTAASLFLADERLVSSEDPESTSGMVRDLYVSRYPDVEFYAPNATDSYPADDYEAGLRFWEEDGTFRAALLGIGTDGHTASLFPAAYPSLLSSQSWVLETQAELNPRLPRITLSPQFIEALPERIFVATGKGKRAVVHRIFAEGEALPVTHLSRKAVVLLDADAAADLPEGSYVLA